MSGLHRHSAQVELQAPSQAKRRFVAEPVELAQAAGTHVQPLGVVAEGLSGLHLDGAIGGDRVVTGVGE